MRYKNNIGLGCIDQQWYLFAHDLARKQLRTFVLSRMRKIQNALTRFHRPADFSISKHLGDSLGVFTAKDRWHAGQFAFALDRMEYFGNEHVTP